MTLEGDIGQNAAFHLSHVLSRAVNCGRTDGSLKKPIPSCRDLAIVLVAFAMLLPVYVLIRLFAVIFSICLVVRRARFDGSSAASALLTSTNCGLQPNCAKKHQRAV
jgi:hypothetical protein